MGVHESQSLLWERMVFQGLPFWKWVTPLFHQHFPHTRDMTPMDFYRIVNRVEPGTTPICSQALPAQLRDRALQTRRRDVHLISLVCVTQAWDHEVFFSCTVWQA